jgi:hypothetical protein
MCVDQNLQLFVEIQKKKTHATHTRMQHTPTRTHTTPTRTHTHAQHAHTPCTPTHSTPARTTLHSTRTSHQRTRKKGKRAQSIQSFIFRSWSCYLCQTHLLSFKGRVQLHGGAANWWSCCSRVVLVELEPSQTRP